MMKDLFKWDSGIESTNAPGTPPEPIGGGEVPIEGPGIDLVGMQVGLGGDTILLYHSNGNPVSEFAATDAGLDSALAAMIAGDVVELPDITIVGGPWTIINGTLKGHSRFGSILDGEITISDDCFMERLSLIRSENDSDPIYGVILEPDSRVEGCYLSVTNADGDVITVYSAADLEGDTYANDNIVLGISANGDGYAYGTDGCSINATDGQAVGSTAPIRM